MNESRKCPKCGAAIDAAWKDALCPACLVKAGFPTGTVAARDARGPAAARLATAFADTKADNNTFAPPPNAPLSIEEVRRHFPQLEILELLGRGGMGVVFKARQPQLDRLVALKILPAELASTPGFAERFTREARALARLHHPNIVSVFDFGQVSSVPSALDPRPSTLFYLILEYVDGANLRQMIASNQIPPETALAIVPKICEALQFAHDEGILHRDIKPENILVDKKGRVKIADFGLAKLTGADSADLALTGSHQVMGTPRYMAPEQFESSKTVDHRADIYSLGVVFYEMLTGEIPMGRFAPPSQKVQVDVRIDEVVLRSLEREPAHRYQHVSEVKSDVEHVTHHGAMASPPSQPKRDGGMPSLHTPPPNHLNNLLGFFMTPQQGYAKAVGYPMIILTGIWMMVTFAVMFLVPEEKGNIIHAVVLGAGLVGIPLGLLILSLRWAVRRGKTPAQVPTTGNSGGANVQSLEKPLDHRVAEAVTTGIPGWFNARAKWVQSLVQGVLMVVWLIGLFAFLCFSFRASSGPGISEKIIAIGAPAPWLEIVHGTMNFRWMIHPFAPSVVLALLGAAAAILYEKIRRSRPGFDAAKDRRSTRRWLIAVGAVVALVAALAAMLVVRKPAWTPRQAVIADAGAGVPAKPKTPFVAGQDGPELSGEAVRYLKLSKLQAGVVNGILQRYATESLALERRHTHVGKDDAGRIVVTVEPFSGECQDLARKMVDELGGLVDSSILPKIEVGRLPQEIFRSAGECNQSIVLWKADGQFHVEETITDWVPAPGMFRSPSSLSFSNPKLEGIPERFRLYWRED
jgi:serine/threonine protein kinase